MSYYQVAKVHVLVRNKDNIWKVGLHDELKCRDECYREENLEGRDGTSSSN